MDERFGIDRIGGDDRLGDRPGIDEGELFGGIGWASGLPGSEPFRSAVEGAHVAPPTDDYGGQVVDDDLATPPNGHAGLGTDEVGQGSARRYVQSTWSPQSQHALRQPAFDVAYGDSASTGSVEVGAAGTPAADLARGDVVEDAEPH